jgi:hypothetical protein
MRRSLLHADSSQINTVDCRFIEQKSGREKQKHFGQMKVNSTTSGLVKFTHWPKTDLGVCVEILQYWQND